jgi:hypothetical protein
LSGLPIIFGTSNGVSTASLDRINNNLGYVIDNVQWTHKAINQMKSDRTQEEFLNLCCLVAERNKNEE